MASLNGDWFHSRSSSNLTELIAVRALLYESREPKYLGFNWSGGRANNPIMYSFAAAINVEPSTMQTKIRAMIRFGFIKDSVICPLIWTRLGSLWNDLFTLGNYEAAKSIYEITLINSLAIYAFANGQHGFSLNPSHGELPLKTLLNLLDKNLSISNYELKILIDGNTARAGKNYSYWRNDLLNSGLFDNYGDSLKYTGKYHEFVDEIKTFSPNTKLTDEDWQRIRENPLLDISPFKDSLTSIFLKLSELTPQDASLDFEEISEPLIDIIAEEEEKNVPEEDILSIGTKYAQGNRRVRNQTWSRRIKKHYLYKCAVAICDVEGDFLLEAAHIKPDNVQEEGLPHRAHTLNGISLCRLCHKLFENGYFSLTDSAEIIISSSIDQLRDQHLKTTIVSSSGQPIKARMDGRLPLQEFIRYHREYKFLK